MRSIRSSRRTTAGARSISFAQNLRFERREFDGACFHHDLAPVACKIQTVAVGYSARAGIDQRRYPPDHVAAGNLEHHGAGLPGLRLFQRAKAEPMQQVAVIRNRIAVDPRKPAAFDVVAFQVEDASNTSRWMGSLGPCRNLADKQHFPTGGIGLPDAPATRANSGSAAPSPNPGSSRRANR